MVMKARWMPFPVHVSEGILAMITIILIASCFGETHSILTLNPEMWAQIFDSYPHQKLWRMTFVEFVSSHRVQYCLFYIIGLHGPLKILEQYDAVPCKHKPKLPKYKPASVCMMKFARRQDKMKCIIATQVNHLFICSLPIFSVRRGIQSWLEAVTIR